MGILAPKKLDCGRSVPTVNQVQSFDESAQVSVRSHHWPSLLYKLRLSCLHSISWPVMSRV